MHPYRDPPPHTRARPRANREQALVYGVMLAAGALATAAAAWRGGAVGTAGTLGLVAAACGVVGLVGELRRG